MDNFEIITKIGEGAYSTVYTVRRIYDDQLYALKKVKMKNLSKKEMQNALNEIRILASVKSPFVISYKEAFIDEKESTLCIVMEYADEGDLFQKITLYKRLHCTFEEIIIWKIFIQIAKGLHDLHEYSILHRDLKSANVFLFKDGRAKLGDLNVSKVAHRGLGCTQTGTPNYASPEVWKDNPYDYKSDIWSLGCVTYEMCMLRTPFRADTMEGLFKKIMIGEYQRVNKKYSEELDYVISLLLQVNPLQRPSTEKILSLDEVKDKIEEYDMFKSNIEGIEGCYNKKKKSKLDLSMMNKDIGNNRKGLNEGYEDNKEDEKNNMQIRCVIDTIRMPKKLVLLEKRLPSSKYESDRILEYKEQNLTVVDEVLPIINHNKVRQRQGSKLNLENVQGNKRSTMQFKMKRNFFLKPSKLNMLIEVYDLYYIYYCYIGIIKIKNLFQRA